MKRAGLGELIAIGSLVLTALVWAVRLEGRVTTVQATHAEAIDQVREDLAYIRARVDQLIDLRLRQGTTSLPPHPPGRRVGTGDRLGACSRVNPEPVPALRALTVTSTSTEAP